MARNISVAFVDYVLDPQKPGRSGLSDIVWDLGEALSRLGVDVHIVGSYRTTIYPIDNVSVHNFTTPTWAYRNIVGNAVLLRRAAKLIRAIRPDVVHTPDYLSTWIFLRLGLSIPMVVTVPGNIFYRESLGGDIGYEWYFAQILKIAAKASAKGCASIIAPSHEMRTWWIRTGSSPEKTPVIPLGVSTKRFHQVDQARSLLGIPREDVVFLYVGRMSPEKGVKSAIEAASRVPREILQRCHIILVGSGQELEVLRELSERRGLSDIVRFKPWVDQAQLSTWYSAADAVLLPSRSESFGRTMVESMACGTPVIASAIGGAKDWIVHGETGYLFEPDNVQELSDLLFKLIGNPALLAHMRESVEQIARSSLNWDVIAGHVLELYDSVLGRDSRPNVAKRPGRDQLPGGGIPSQTGGTV